MSKFLDFVLDFVFFIAVAAMVTVFALLLFSETTAEKQKRLCEQDLPRSQQCVMQFVPEEK